jgi:hypothetical protein
MNQLEKRQLPRLVPGDVPRGDLMLHHSGESAVIESVRDISNSGMSLSTNTKVPVSARVSVRYCGAQLNIEVYGRVAWCNETQLVDPQSKHPGKYLMGVELLSPMMLLAALPKRYN